ncbi:exonuclease domain-containing protein [Capnocytophaga canis]|uniref:exonuclease domain-containing protein n=1 Tax=Capnocytophaga canis TaxID=1848903 RepID=UPI00370D400F
MYAILDIETTGGKFNEEGITEIAIYRFDGHEVVDQFITLINPEREIQDFVVKLTGINNKMLRNAPKFYEVAKRIIEITQDCVIVAHNASFDYRILQTEYRRLGYDFSRTTLCTVELAQRLIPGKESYSLGKLARSLGIPVSERHRACGDALATVKLFKYLLEKDSKKEIITTYLKSNAPTINVRHIRMLDELPERLGVYYMYNEAGEIIYIGKNKNIKKRVTQHFSSPLKRDVLLQKQTYKITYEETGNELITRLKELHELEHNNPKYNKNNKSNTTKINYVLTSHFNRSGYLCFSTEMFQTQKTSFITTFETIHQAQNFLYQITEEFGLCPKLQRLSEAKKNCHNYTIKKCNGACIDEEAVEIYNQRAEQVIKKYGFVNQIIAIIDKGRTFDEKSVILVVNGIVKGYGFFNLNYQLSQVEILENLITPLPNSLKNRHIIQSYVRNHKVKIIPINTQNSISYE